MPDSESPSAADCRWLEDCPGEVSVHGWPAFTPIPRQSLLAPAREGTGRVDLCAGAGSLRWPSRGVILVTPKELVAVLRWESDVSPKQERRWLPAWDTSLPCVPPLRTSPCRQHSTRLLKRHGCPVSPLTLIIY